MTAVRFHLLANATLSFAALLAAAGCAKQTPSAGPGADNGHVGSKLDLSKAFSLGLPRGEVLLSQGTEVKIKVEINRGEKFLESVTVVFEPPPGLTLEPLQATANNETDNVEGLVTAATDVEPGEYQIKVTGKSENGYQTSGAIDITINNKQQEPRSARAEGRRWIAGLPLRAK
jgi:hypothetical protein